MFFFCLAFYSKTRLITRDELTIDWKLLYQWGKLILFNHDESYSLIAMPKFVCRISKIVLFVCFFLEISKTRTCYVYVVVDRIFLHMQHKRFSMNFDRVCVRLILSAEMLCAIGIRFCRFIYHRNYIIKDLST